MRNKISAPVPWRRSINGWTDTLKAAGWAAHTLRHRFATVAYSTTHDLFVVAELLGHESVETTEHYVAMPDGRLREATAAVRLT